MPIKGVIEIHGPEILQGWCVDTEDRGAPVDLDIYWDNVLLRTIKADIARKDIADWLGDGPSGFRFGLRPALLNQLPPSVLTIRSRSGVELGIFKPERLEPIGCALDGGKSLRMKLGEGYFVDKWGALHKPFSAMGLEERAKFANGIVDVSEYFRERFQIQLFGHYGTLLGYARGKKFLEHDDDTDLSFVLRTSSLDEVAAKFHEIVGAIRADGHSVYVENTGQMKVALQGRNHSAPDVFVSWHEDDGTFWTYFGVQGRFLSDLSFRQDTIEGVPMTVPTEYEKLLEFTYGPNWRTPDPHFRWKEPASVQKKMKELREAGKKVLQV